MKVFVRQIALLTATAWILAGCSGGQALDDEGLQPERSFGLLAVHVAPAPVAGGLADTESSGGIEISASAQFVRYHAMSSQQLARLLALPLNAQRDLPPLDSCRVYELSTELTDEDVDSEGTAAVDLLEAGEVHVQPTRGQGVTLVPRYFPGLLPFVSGVVYSEAQATSAERPGQVIASSGGGEIVGSFRAEGQSPDPLSLSATSSLGPGYRVVALRWQPARSEGARGDDVTYVELRSARAGAERALRCRTRDDGAFDVDARMLSLLSSEAGASLTVEAGRFRRHAFAVRGLDTAELRLSTSERLTISSP